MDAQQIALVRRSFAQVVPISAAAAAIFYERLFALAPEVRPLFRNDMAAQGAKLMLTLASVVKDLDRPERLVPAAQELARRHVAYGVQDRHYAAVGTALIETLRQGTGAAFTPEVEAAWRAAYDVLSSTMIAASRRAA